jgi:hypothetical protein
MIDLFITTIVVMIILYYAIVKEREELGCFRVSIEKQCDDGNSVFLKNTKLEKTDTCDDALQRLLSILSYHEKGAIWRRCVIMSFVSVLGLYVLHRASNQSVSMYTYVLFLIINFAIIYFYHHYIEYHHFRNLKYNGEEIIQFIKIKCFSQKK